MALGILSAMGMSPNELQGTLVKMFGSKTTAVLTNVPGPPMPLYMAGQRIEELMFWVPQSGRVSLGISIISYANKVFMGVASDVGLVPDPDLIMEGFYEEFATLMALVREAEAVAAEEAATTEAPVVKASAAKKAVKAAAPAKTAVSSQSAQCQATTKSGKQCRNRALADSDYCRVHQK